MSAWVIFMCLHNFTNRSKDHPSVGAWIITHTLRLQEKIDSITNNVIKESHYECGHPGHP
jgi:hypothetical protein